MPTAIQEAVRRLTIVAEQRGLREAQSALGNLAKAQDQVTVASERTERATVSVDRSYRAIQRRYDEVARAEMEIARVSRILTAAQAQGIATSDEQARVLLALEARYRAAGQAATISGTQIVAANRNTMQMSRQLSFQLVDIGQALATAPTMGIYALQNLGFQVAQIGQLYMGQGGFTQAIKDSATQVASFTARFAPLAAAAGVVAIAIAGMRAEINATSAVQVSFGDVALGVLQTVRDGIYELLQPAIQAIAPWFSATWNIVVADFKAVNNALIAGWVTAFDAIKIVWKNFPNVLGEIVLGTVNTVIGYINTMIQKTAAAIDRLIAMANRIPGVNIGQIGQVEGIGDLGTNVLSGSAAATASEIGRAGRENFSTDYLGEFFSGVRQNAIENAIERTKDKAKKAREELSKLGKAALDGLTDAADANLEAVERAQKALAQAADYVADRFDQFFDGIKKGESVWESLRNTALTVLEDIARAALRSGITNLLAGAFGGATTGALNSGISLFGAGDFNAAGQLIPAAVAHSGWDVGAPPPATRAVAAGLFDLAPRLHKGLAPDEFPAVLQRGERVQSRAQVAAGAGEVAVRVYVDDEGALRAYVDKAAGRAAGARISEYDSGSMARHVANSRKAQTRRLVS